MQYKQIQEMQFEELLDLYADFVKIDNYCPDFEPDNVIHYRLHGISTSKLRKILLDKFNEYRT